MDVMLTSVGKRALAEGDLDVRYYSFGDRSSAYLVEGESGGRVWFAEPDLHLMIEAHSKSTDLVTLTVDDFGDIVRDEALVLEGDDFVSFSGERSSVLLGAEVLERLGTNWGAALSSVASISPMENEGVFEVRKTTEEISRKLWDNEAIQRITQHLPITEDEEFASLVQMEFLPPVVVEGEVERALGSWNRVFPEPPIFGKDVLDSAYRQGRECLRVDLERSTGSFQFFLVEEESSSVLPLTVVRSETGEQGLRSWVVGELMDVGGETHFFRLFRVFYSEGRVEDDFRKRLLKE